MAAFSDDFNRADGDSLGANWTEAAGDADISSNLLRFSTGGFGVIACIYTGTPCSGINQYVRVQFVGGNVQYPGVILRSGNSSGPYYVLQIDGNNGGVEWYRFTSWADTSGDLIGSGTFSHTMSGDTVGFTIDGTGAASVIRGFLNPTGTPTAADTWGGSATFSLTDDPGANAVDTGNYVGLFCQQASANAVTFDNFFGGDIPGAAAGGQPFARRFGGVPFAANHGAGYGKGNSGRMWGRSRDGLYFPQAA